MYERRLNAFHHLSEPLAEFPVSARTQTPSIEVDDLDLHAQLTQTPNLLLDEHTADRMGRRRIHVGDEEDAQRASALAIGF